MGLGGRVVLTAGFRSSVADLIVPSLRSALLRDEWVVLALWIAERSEPLALSSALSTVVPESCNSHSSIALALCDRFLSLSSMAAVTFPPYGTSAAATALAK
jgi:hypothetical protein